MLCDFEVYTGQAEAGDDGLTYTGQAEAGDDGLTYDVVRRLTDRFDHQGYTFVTDNFYTSAALGETMTQHGSHLVGTIRTNRRGFPAALKNDTKLFLRQADRGATRYVRQGDAVIQQWKDKRVVSVLSTFHHGHAQCTCHTERKA